MAMIDTLDPVMAFSRLKKLPFAKSWANNFVSKDKNIINLTTGKPEKRELDVFVYIPAPVLIQYLSSDKEFLGFRLENKFSSDYDFKLLADKNENNNRRLAVMYAAQYFKAAEVEFLIDDAYTIYITNEELQKFNCADTAKREFYNSLYIPKHFGGRKGSEETFS